MKSAISLGLGMLSMLVLSACNQQSEQAAATQPILTTTAQKFSVVEQTVPVHNMTSGTVTSDHRVLISSRLSGYIRDIKVREGDRIKIGQVLVHIDPVNAKQALVQAKADLHHAKLEMQRYKSLLSEGAVTSQQFDTVQLRYQVANSQVKQAKHQLSYAEVISPVNGVVVEKRMSKGDLAAPGMPILTLEDPSSLLVQTYVSEQFVAQIHTGDAVDVNIASLKRHFKGIVRQVVQAADPVSHQFLIKVSLPSSKDIHPGMYAQTGFKVGMRNALLIPQESIIQRDGLYAVYIVDAASIAHYRLIRIGQRRADKSGREKIEVLAGLHDGDSLAWGGKPALKTGMKVRND